MIKNILIIVLTFISIIYWLKAEPEDADDPNDVTIEYKCDSIDQYETVPAEVIEECRNRGLSLNKT